MILIWAAARLNRQAGPSPPLIRPGASVHRRWLGCAPIPSTGSAHAPPITGIEADCVSQDSNAAHFLLITLWDSMESVKMFAGEHPEKAKYYPEDDSLLLEKEATSALYELFFEK